MKRINTHELLGEFRRHLVPYGGGYFNHVIKTEIGKIEIFGDLGKVELVGKHYENIIKYIFALRNLQEFRERELKVPIPRECFRKGSNDEYIDRAFQIARNKKKV